MVSVAVGALIGTFASGAGGFIFGSTIWASVAYGALVGYSVHSQLNRRDISTQSSSPTYSFGAISNSKTQKLPIPLAYGGWLRLAGNIFFEKFEDEKQRVVFRYIGISGGVITEVKDVKGGELLLADQDGCAVDVYLTSDASTVAPYDPEGGARPFPNNFAFVALKMTASEKLNGSAVITMLVKGRKVWTPEGVMFTDNPAWIIRDFLTDQLDGVGIPLERIDEASFAAAAQYYGENIINPDGSVSPRFSLSYIVDNQKKAVDHIADMLACCRSMLVSREKISLFVDAPAAVVPYKVIDESNIIEKSFTWWQKSDDEIYNRVVIEWIDPDNAYEQSVVVFENADDIAKRGLYEKSYSLLGITNKHQAARMGAYLLDSSAGVKNFCSFNVSLKDADIEVLDVIALTHSVPGWVNKNMRVITITDVNNKEDEVQITCAEYVPEIYNDRAMDFPVHIDTSLKNPFDFLPMGFKARQDRTAKNKIVLEWKPVVSFALDHYEVREGTQWDTGTVIADRCYETSLSVVKDRDGIYNFMLKAVSIDGNYSKIAYTSITVVNLTPSKVEGVTASGEYRLIHVKWIMPEDTNIGYFEVYSSPTDKFEDAELAGKINGTAFDLMGLGVLETRWVWVLAVSAFDLSIKSPRSEVASATTSAMPEIEIPDASIGESQLMPGLAAKIDTNPDTDAIASIRHSIKDDAGTANIFEEKVIRFEKDNVVVRKTEMLTAETVANKNSIQENSGAIKKNTAAIQETAEIVSGKNGLVAQKYIKTDVNGKVAGYGTYNDGNVSEFSVLADHFFISKAGETGNTKVFEVDAKTGKVQLIGDLIASGSIVGEQISARARINLAEGGAIVAGKGALIQIGNTDNLILLDTSSSFPRIRCDGDGEYVEMTSGQVRHYIYRDNVAILQHSLSQIETGVCQSGEWKILNNYYENKPDVSISPHRLMSYKSGVIGDQTFLLEIPDNASEGGIQPTGIPGKWTFKPIAKLLIGASGGVLSRGEYPTTTTQTPPAYKPELKGYFIKDTYVVVNDDNDMRLYTSEVVTDPISMGRSGISSISVTVSGVFRAVRNSYDSDGGNVYYASCYGEVSILYSTNASSWSESPVSSVHITSAPNSPRTLTATISGLATGSTYYIKIRIKNKFGSDSYNLGNLPQYSSNHGDWGKITIDSISYSTPSTQTSIPGTVNYIAIGR